MSKLANLFNKITGGIPLDKAKENEEKEDSKFLVYKSDPIEIKFAKHFSSAEGKFFFCESILYITKN